MAGKTQHDGGSEHPTAKMLSFIRVEKVRKLSVTKDFSIKPNSRSQRDPRLRNILRMGVRAYEIHIRMEVF